MTALFWLEVHDDDVRHIAHFLAESGYTTDELLKIFLEEVFPACQATWWWWDGYVDDTIAQNLGKSRAEPIYLDDHPKIARLWHRVMTILPEEREKCRGL